MAKLTALQISRIDYPLNEEIEYQENEKDNYDHDLSSVDDGSIARDSGIDGQCGIGVLYDFNDSLSHNEMDQALRIIKALIIEDWGAVMFSDVVRKKEIWAFAKSYADVLPIVTNPKTMNKVRFYQIDRATAVQMYYDALKIEQGSKKKQPAKVAKKKK